MIKALVLTLMLFSFGSELIGQNLNSVARGQRGYTPERTNLQTGEPEPPDVHVLSQERADIYQQILGIDDFQKEVLKSFLKEHYQKTSEIGFDVNLKFDEKLKKINAEKKILEKNLLDVFSKDQTETILSEEKFGTETKKVKKEKKKEKRKKRKEDKDNG